MDKTRILVVNPGSTSTKIALFDDYDKVFSLNLDHEAEDLKKFKEVGEQLGYRTDVVAKTMADNGYELSDVNIFVARGGGLIAIEGGVYEADGLLVEHATIGMAGQHPAQLGSQIVRRYADKFGGKAYVVNPPDVDELCDVARVTGIKGIYRQSHLHALNQREIALRFCRERGINYGDTNIVVCHLGGGVSITAHEKGRMIDTNDILKGAGPMTPTRAGDMAFVDVIKMAYSGEYTEKELIDKLNVNGGLTDHFGTADMREVEKLMTDGDKYAEVIINGMIYQIAKYVGAMAVAMKGKVDATILTGGIAHGKYTTGLIAEYVGWIAEVVVMPGEFELEALAGGALRVHRGEEELKAYTGIPVWNGF